MHINAYDVSMISFNDHSISEMATYFKLLSEPHRLKILNLICQGEKSVSEVCRLVDIDQSNISRHLLALSKAKLISRRREGKVIYYQVADHPVLDLCKSLCESLHKGGQIPPKKPKKNSVKKEVHVIQG